MLELLIFFVFKIPLTFAPKLYGTKFRIHNKHEAKFDKLAILMPPINIP